MSCVTCSWTIHVCCGQLENPARRKLSAGGVAHLQTSPDRPEIPALCAPKAHRLPERGAPRRMTCVTIGWLAFGMGICRDTSRGM